MRLASISDRAGFALCLALLLLLGAVLLWPGLEHGPIERAEIYFLDVARAMVESGDYLVPRYQGAAFFDKPAMTYWAIASAFHLGGCTPGVGRHVSAVAGLLSLAATALLGLKLVGRKAALAGGLIFITTLGVMSFGRLAMSDMLLCFFCTFAAALAVMACERPASPVYVPALGAVLGLGFLTKGPIALLLPGLGIAVLLWQRRRDRLPIRWSAVVLGAILFVVTGLFWFFWVWRRLGVEPLVYFFFRENLARFAGETYDTGRAPWYYLGAYLIQGLPWSLLFPLAAWHGFKHEETNPRLGPRFLLVWLAAMAVPLSLSRGKLDYYLLPLFPAVSLLIGWLFARAWGRLERTWVRVVLVLQAVALAGAIVVRTGIHRPWLPPPRMRYAVAVVVVLAAAALLVAAFRARPRSVVLAVAGSVSSVFLAYALILVPAFRNGQPNLTITRDILRERRYQPELRLALCRDRLRVQRDVLFFARLAAEERCELWSPASSKRPFLLLLEGNERETFAEAELRVVGEYRFLPATAFTFAGLFRTYDADEVALLANFSTKDPVAKVRFKRSRKHGLDEKYHPRLKRGFRKKRGRVSTTGSPS